MIAAAGALFAVSHLVSSSGRAGSAALPAAPASFLGVYETGPPGTYRPVADFTRAVGRQPNLAGYYGGWGEAFKASFATTVRRHGAVTLLQWDPTFASIRLIAAGATAVICARSPAASANSAARWSSASGMR